MREKLIELTDDVLKYLPWGQISSHTAKEIADHLIANGVTIQKWIPVTERLPSLHDDVLLYFKEDDNMAAGYLDDVDEDRTMWCAYSDGGYYTDCDYEPTHWMTLPEPPEIDK